MEGDTKLNQTPDDDEMSPYEGTESSSNSSESSDTSSEEESKDSVPDRAEKP